MEGMFAGCKKLKEIKGINNFITNKVKSMEAIFYLCNGLEYLDLSKWNTSNLRNMKYMFNNCNKLKEIKGINNFITNKVESMEGIFVICNELEYLDLSNWNTSNVRNMSFMFNQCNKLKYLNIINFSINCSTKNMLSFKKLPNFEFITKNKDLSKLFTFSS